MPEQFDLEAFRIHLRKQRLPNRYTQHVEREVSAHIDDLRNEGIQQGLTPEEATNFALLDFGEAFCLANQFGKSWRARPWYFRHPLIGFGFLPIVCVLGLFLSAILVTILATRSLGTSQTDTVFAAGATNLIPTIIKSAYALILGAVSLKFFTLAGRTESRVQFASITLTALTVHGVFHEIVVVSPAPTQHGHLVWTYGFHFDWVSFLVPIGCLAVCLFVSSFSRKTRLSWN